MWGMRHTSRNPSFGRELSGLQRDLWRDYPDRRIVGTSSEPPNEGDEVLDAREGTEVAVRRTPGCSEPRPLEREPQRRRTTC